MLLTEFRRILYATDLGHTACNVFSVALSLAKRYGASLYVVYAVEPMGFAARHAATLYTGGEYNDTVEAGRETALKAEIGERLDALCADGLAGKCDRDVIGAVEVLHGKPWQAIVEYSEKIGADMVVLGSHGHTTVGEVMLGSTAHRVAQKSRVPVLLVPAEDLETGDGV